MPPSASATCSAVRSWKAASSSAFLSAVATARRALCTASPAPALPPTLASSIDRARRDDDVRGSPACRVSPARLTAR